MCFKSRFGSAFKSLKADKSVAQQVVGVLGHAQFDVLDFSESFEKLLKFEFSDTLIGRESFEV